MRFHIWRGGKNKTNEKVRSQRRNHLIAHRCEAQRPAPEAEALRLFKDPPFSPSPPPLTPLCLLLFSSCVNLSPIRPSNTLSSRSSDPTGCCWKKRITTCSARRASSCDGDAFPVAASAAASRVSIGDGALVSIGACWAVAMTCAGRGGARIVAAGDTVLGGCVFIVSEMLSRGHWCCWEGRGSRCGELW